MRYFSLSMLAAFSFATAALAAAPTVDHAWVRLVPGQSNAAGYLTVQSSSDQDDAITGVTSDCCTAIELHEMADEGDHMTMRKVDRVPLPAHGKATFKPGSYHLMLFGVKHPDAKTLTAALQLQSGGKLPVTFTIKTIGEEMKGMDMGGMKTMPHDGAMIMDHGSMHHE